MCSSLCRSARDTGSALRENDAAALREVSNITSSPTAISGGHNQAALLRKHVRILDRVDRSAESGGDKDIDRTDAHWGQFAIERQ